MKKTLLSSIVAILICASILCGSTFALFTSESKVNVAVSSATVQVEAYLEKDPVLSSELGSNLPETSVTYNETDNKINVTNMVPGDKVDFTINIYNKSNVTIKYRLGYDVTADEGLINVLKIFAGTEELSSKSSKAYDWSQPLAPAVDNTIPVLSVPVTISLPVDAGNVYQAKTMEFSFHIEAIQGNAYTGPAAAFNEIAATDMPTSDEIDPLGFGFPAPTGPVKLEAAYSFADQETAESLATSPYKDWICDFIIECDQDLAVNELGLAGQYDLFGDDWVAFLSPMAVKAGQKVPMMISAGLQLTYEGVCSSVEVFNCGVFRGIDPDQNDGLDAMVGIDKNGMVKGKKVTVSLCMINMATFEPKFNAKVEEFMQANPNLSSEEAFAMACDWQWYAVDVDYIIVKTQTYAFGPVSQNN